MSTGKTKADFISAFHKISRHKHRHDVFRDFVTISAISLHNAISMNEALEAEYMQIIKDYNSDELQQFCQLLSILIELLEPEPKDILGSLYMELDLGNQNVGQFFTPPELSKMMAEMLYGADLEKLDQPYITLSEPACGAGGMVLAFVKVMIDKKLNPAHKLWTQCIDIDRLSAMMCYIQLTLWNIPAEVVVGDTLRYKFREVFYTPAHYLYGWDFKLATKQAGSIMGTPNADIVPNDTQEPSRVPSSSPKLIQPSQFDLGF